MVLTFSISNIDEKNFMFPEDKIDNGWDCQAWMFLCIVIFFYTYLSQKLDARASYNWPKIGTGI